jgi:hypothetical protein
MIFFYSSDSVFADPYRGAQWLILISDYFWPFVSEEIYYIFCALEGAKIDGFSVQVKPSKELLVSSQELSQVYTSPPAKNTAHLLI